MRRQPEGLLLVWTLHSPGPGLTHPPSSSGCCPHPCFVSLSLLELPFKVCPSVHTPLDTGIDSVTPPHGTVTPC